MLNLWTASAFFIVYIKIHYYLDLSEIIGLAACMIFTAATARSFLR